MKVGFIGPGTMGGPVALNCRNNGKFEIDVHDLRREASLSQVEAGARWAAVRQCSLGRQRSFDRLGKQFLQGKFEPPNFALKLALKDCMLATELGREVGVPMRIANPALAEMLEGVNRGWSERDSRVPMLIQEERAGVNIKVPAAAIEAVLKRDG